jgi:hypothetical protein
MKQFAALQLKVAQHIHHRLRFPQPPAARAGNITSHLHVLSYSACCVTLRSALWNDSSTHLNTSKFAYIYVQN